MVSPSKCILPATTSLRLHCHLSCLSHPPLSPGFKQHLPASTCTSLQTPANTEGPDTLKMQVESYGLPSLFASPKGGAHTLQQPRALEVSDLPASSSPVLRPPCQPLNAPAPPSSALALSSVWTTPSSYPLGIPLTCSELVPHYVLPTSLARPGYTIFFFFFFLSEFFY